MNVVENHGRAASKLLTDALHLLFPATCALCEREIESSASASRFICSKCLRGIERLEHPVCFQCGDPITSDMLDLCEHCAHEEVQFDLARSYGIYDGPLARAIQQLKYGRERALTHDLAFLFKIMLVEEKLENRFDAITFVPLTRKKRFARGFNQAELLARKLGNFLDMPVVSTLNKTRETQSQMELSGTARRENLQGAFESKQIASWNRLLLVDDVYTTGTTISECAAELKTADVDEVIAITLARAPLVISTENFDEY